jgi:hypothetical protein
MDLDESTRVRERRSNKMKVLTAVLAMALGVAGAVALVPVSASADDAACGTRTNPCPLQKWMQDNVGSKLSDGNLDAVATSLDKVATIAPDPAWADWSKFAKDGAAAARRGGDDGTRAAKVACKGCHDKYKTDYKAKFRTRAVP